MKTRSIPTVIPTEEVKFDTFTAGERCDRYVYPHRFELGCFILIVEGRGKLAINLRDYDIKRNDTITLVPGSIIQIREYSGDLEFKVVGFSPEFVRELNLMRDTLPQLEHARNNPVISMSEEYTEIFLEYCSVFSKVHDKLEEHRIQSPVLVKSMLVSFLYMIITVYKHRTEAANAPVLIRNEEITREFQNLVLRHYKEERTVGFYARKLFITPKYLSDVVKHTTGKSSTDYISEAVLLDAKVQLQSTARSIQEISDSLHFPNQSFFAKYFKKHVGVSPKAYRENTPSI